MAWCETAKIQSCTAQPHDPLPNPTLLCEPRLVQRRTSQQKFTNDNEFHVSLCRERNRAPIKIDSNITVLHNTSWITVGRTHLSYVPHTNAELMGCMHHVDTSGNARSCPKPRSSSNAPVRAHARLGRGEQKHEAVRINHRGMPVQSRRALTIWDCGGGGSKAIQLSRPTETGTTSTQKQGLAALSEAPVAEFSDRTGVVPRLMFLSSCSAIKR